MFEARIHVLTVSDRAHAGVYDDVAGPTAVAELREAFPKSPITNTIVPDHVGDITDAIDLARKEGARIIITLGGTGIAPRDVTPEATAELIDRNLPGVAEDIRQAGKNSTLRAVVSRGMAGVINADPTHGYLYDVVIVNLAGSPDAAQVGCGVLIPLIPHLVAQLDGGDHRGH